MSAVRRLLDRLPSAKPAGRGWKALCPAHEDTRPSLSIASGDGGRVLVKCFAGCETTAVMEALGLGLEDLMPEDVAPERLRIVAQYHYADEQGKHLYDVLRYAPKCFKQRRADGAWTMGDVRRVLYRLPELHGQSLVFIVEGEKDADRLASIGLIATCNVGGAGKWREDYTEQLLNAGAQHVIILPDRDDAGRLHAETVAKSCQDAGLHVKVIALPGLTAKGDVSDWLAAGHTREDLVRIVDAVTVYGINTTTGEFKKSAVEALKLTTVSDLLAEPDEVHGWLVEGRLAYGSVNLLVGRPKGGKSTLARALALSVARGDRWLGYRCQRGHVVYIALEDKRSEVRRHLRMMGADGHEPIRLLIGSAPRDLLVTLNAMMAAGDPVDLLIIDTAQRLLAVRDSNDYAVVTAAFEPVLALARTHNCCIVLLHHAGKADRSGLESVMGSTAWAASVDNVLLLNRKDRYRLLSSIQRIGPDLDETVVVMDDQTGEVRMGGSRHLVDLAHVADTLRATVADAGQQGIAQLEALQQVEARRDLKLKALKHLLDTGSLTRVGAGNRHDPFVLRAGRREPDGVAATVSRGVSSGSQVPIKDWEPDDSKTVSGKVTSVSEDSSGSQNSTGSEEAPLGRF